MISSPFPQALSARLANYVAWTLLPVAQSSSAVRQGVPVRARHLRSYRCERVFSAKGPDSSFGGVPVVFFYAKEMKAHTVTLSRSAQHCGKRSANSGATPSVPVN